MGRLIRWVLISGVCALFTMAACTRPVPRRAPREHTTAERSVRTDRVGGGPTPTSSVPSGSSQPLQTANPADRPGTAAAAASPSPAFPGVYSGIPTPDVTPTAQFEGRSVGSYTVGSGDVVGAIAARFDCTVEEIVAANGLPNADSIYVGQSLVIPITATRVGRDMKLVPDSELVYGPAYIHFDLADFVREQGGYLADYSERVEGRVLTGAEIVQLISERFSVGPRVLLALLELRSGWVTQSQPPGDTLYYPLGHFEARYEGLVQQLRWASDRLNEGYYGWKRGDRTSAYLANGTRSAAAPELNAGSVGVQNCLAELSSTWDEWLDQTGPVGFMASYQRLFGNPFAYTVDPLVPVELTQPGLRLPWEAGQTWYLTGGPHGGWADGSGRPALDFVADAEYLGCTPSRHWVTAAAAGRVVRSAEGQVILDLDGDGYEQSGWVLQYMHIHTEGRVETGAFLQRGERIGHPSCEGGFSEATHLHIARRYNGEWIPAGTGSMPLVLSGWTAHDGASPYDGTMTQGSEVRTACECWEDSINGLVSDNVP